jgi:hypothetical protein
MFSPSEPPSASGEGALRFNEVGAELGVIAEGQGLVNASSPYMSRNSPVSKQEKNTYHFGGSSSSASSEASSHSGCQRVGEPEWTKEQVLPFRKVC